MPPTTVAENPYVGPRSFQDTDSDRARYYARDEEAETLFSLILMHRLVLFYSSSGAGKSSLINARLKPYLQQENFTVLPTCRVGGTTNPDDISSNVFVYNLLAHLAPNSNQDELAGVTLSSFLQANLKPPETEDEYFEATRILIIDQFEEIVTAQREHWAQRHEFFQQLAQAMKDDPLLWVLLVMREDYIASIEPYAHLLPDKLRVRYHMQRMDAEAALEAIEEPAKQFGRPFEATVAEQIVNDLRQIRVTNREETVAGEFVEPVQLQVVCYELWLRLQDQPAPIISQADINAFADVDRTLGDYYARAIENVAVKTNVTERQIRKWFEDELITESDTRNIIFRREQTTGNLPNEAVELLANEYFILRSDTRAGGLWYELAHDRFIPAIRKSNNENSASTKSIPKIALVILTTIFFVLLSLLAQLFSQASAAQAQTSSIEQTANVNALVALDLLSTRDSELATEEYASLNLTIVAESATQTKIYGSDEDSDGLSFEQEVEIGTNPNKTDTDNDGLNDGEEVLQYNTLPLDKDTDRDGQPDGIEISLGTDPLTWDSTNIGTPATIALTLETRATKRPSVTPAPSSTPNSERIALQQTATSIASSIRTVPHPCYEPTATQSVHSAGDTRVAAIDGMTLVYVPAGNFLMGSTNDEINEIHALCLSGVLEGECKRSRFEDEAPIHQIKLESFWIDQTEVSNAMFLKCV